MIRGASGCFGSALAQLRCGLPVLWQRFGLCFNVHRHGLGVLGRASGCFGRALRRFGRVPQVRPQSAR